LTKSNPVYEFLLLDDDEDDYVLLKSLLDGAFGDAIRLDWYQKDGVATEMICSGIYAVTFVEYQLGNENGLEVIRKAKDHCPDHIVFLLTSWTYHVTVEQAQQSGADGYLKKAELSIDSLKAVLSPFLPEVKTA